MFEVLHSSGLLAAFCIGFGSIFTNLLHPDFSGIFISVIVIVSYTVVSSMYFFVFSDGFTSLMNTFHSLGPLLFLVRHPC